MRVSKKITIPLLLLWLIMTILYLSQSDSNTTQRNLAHIRNDFERYIDAGYFLQSASLALLQKTYQTSDKKIRILLVPGHTNESPGAEYKDLREVAINRELIDLLYRGFEKEDWAIVEVASLHEADQNNFQDFFEQSSQLIEQFELYQKSISDELRTRFLVAEERHHSYVTAPRNIAAMLYGINVYAAEAKFDLVLHIHFNDYPREHAERPGEHEGYAIYVPDKLFSSSRASTAIAHGVAQKLSEHYATSTHPLETKGVIENREFIALGAHNTLRTPAILVEYAYIYEDFLQDDLVRKGELEKMSQVTIAGIKRSLEQ